MSAGDQPEPGPVLARFVNETYRGALSVSLLERGATYRTEDTWGTGSILKKLPDSGERLPTITITCSHEIFELLRLHKKHGKESIGEAVERLIRAAPDVRGCQRQPVTPAGQRRVRQRPLDGNLQETDDGLKPGQVVAQYIRMAQSGIVCGTQLHHHAVYQVEDTWSNIALLKKIEGSDNRLPKLICAKEVFDLFRRYKKHPSESVAEGIERLIREAPSVR